VSISVSAPGSLMLLGEHAVLHGQPAIVAALNRRIKVTLRTRRDRSFEIISDLGVYQGDLDALEIKPPFDYVLSAITQLRDQLDQGFTLLIHSEFEAAMGLGSSTAVVVAVVAALLHLYGQDDRDTVFSVSLAAIRAVQTQGSGADVAASVYGGALYFDPKKCSADQLTTQLPCTLIYSGKKTKTADVIDFVRRNFKERADEERDIYQQIGACVTEAKKALSENDMAAFSKAVNNNHVQMQALGVCNKKLCEIIDYAKSLPGVLTAKISGSGLGDCAVVFGTLDRAHCPYPVIDIKMEGTGIIIESAKT
jgi:mevalonate kinase